jgi:DNA processing protein
MTIDSEQTLSWIGLGNIPGVGRVTFRRLVGRFGSPSQVLRASRDELMARGEVTERIAREITTFPWRGPAEAELARAERADVPIITFDDPLYPEALRSVADAPLLLYIKGTLLPGDDAAVAIVGTRTPTHYGTTMALRMAGELAASGVTVVSGMARGIDTQAHKGALDSRGRTIAVLGCGIDVCYPPENRKLMEQIATSGAVVTENPFGTRPESGYFPARNRIISGLSLGTVIIEAAEDSGSLITADYALKQGRRLFAVPGNVSSPSSRGTNNLIKQGAMLVETAADVLRSVGGAIAPRVSHECLAAPGMNDEERKVFSALSADPKHIDVIMAESGTAPGVLSGLLTSLELKGLIQQLPGKHFVRANMP